MLSLKVKKLVEDAIIPTYATEGSAGFDLYSTDEFIINPSERFLVSTGIAFDIPSDYEIQIRPRSGLASKFGITVLNSPGTIDSDFRGPVSIILYNSGHTSYRINKGDRIAQGVLARVDKATFEEVGKLSTTIRNESGFGSTGVN